MQLVERLGNLLELDRLRDEAVEVELPVERGLREEREVLLSSTSTSSIRAGGGTPTSVAVPPYAHIRTASTSPDVDVIAENA
jgi:hypothetical protein